MTTLDQALKRAQEILGKKAVVERSDMLSPEGRQQTWRVGVRGGDTYAWMVLGVSTTSFERALDEAQGKRNL
jgi:hypothetical protein